MRLSSTDKKILNTLGIIHLFVFSLMFQEPKITSVKISPISVTQPKKIILPEQITTEEIQVATTTIKKEKFPSLKSEKLKNIRERLLSRLNIKQIPNIKINKKITIAVIDTGLNINVSAFHNRLYLPKELIKDPNGYGLDFSTDEVSYKPIDTHGHGSNVTGIIISLFPQAKILPIKYYNPKKSGVANLEALNKSLKAAIDANVDIINLSGGGPEADNTEYSLLKEAQEKGIIVVLAAGNEKSNLNKQFKEKLNDTYYPASYNLDNMISVMNLDDKNNIVSSSNFGQFTVHLGALGSAVYSYGSPTDKNCTVTMTGTSQATPIVTATVAMIKAEFPHLSYSEIKNKILNNTQKIKILENMNSTGGSLDIERVLANVKEQTKRQ